MRLPLVGAESTSMGSSRSILFLLIKAKVARLEKRVVDGLLLENGPVIMDETLDPTAGGLVEVGEEEDPWVLLWWDAWM